MAASMKLNQVNAIVTGRKTDIEKAVGELHKVVQKPQLFNGFTRTYKPKDELNGDKLPPEEQKVQQKVTDLLAQAIAKWRDLWRWTLTQDVGNQQAKADIEVDGKVILPNVPVTNLLFIDKQINDLESLVEKLPTPDSAETWEHDANQGLLRARTPTESIKTVKKPAKFEKAPATDKHPAQVEFYHEDVPVGVWTKVNFSAACPADTKAKWLAKLKKLKDAVKLAREKANMTEVQKQDVDPIFQFVFSDELVEKAKSVE